MRTANSVLTICLLAILILPPVSAQVKTKSHKDEEKPLSGAGKGIVVSATVTRSAYRTGYGPGSMSSPAWDITLLIQNHTNGELQLGDSLILIEKERDSQEYLAFYAARERSEPAIGLARMKQRFNLSWGYEVKPDGSYMMMFTGGGMFHITMSHADPYPGSGYGRVSARAERQIKVQIPAPYRLKGTTEYIAVIPPSVKPVKAPPQSQNWATQTALRFEAGAVKDGETLKPATTTTIPLRGADLRPMVANSTHDLWQRIFALNWLAETQPKTAVEPVLETLVDKNAPPLLRSSAALNLGALKAAPAVQPLIETLRSTEDATLMQSAINALGDIGDGVAAPAVRPFLNRHEESMGPVVAAAIEAVGKLKDAESVETLVAVFTDQKRKRLQSAAGDALAAIGNRAAMSALLNLLRDTRNEVSVEAAEKLALTGAPEAVTALVAVVNDRKTSKELRSKAISSLGKLGGAEALNTLRAAADSEREEIRNDALEALGKMKDTPALEAVILFAEKGGYASRVKAVRVLSASGKADALPSLRRIVADKSAPGNVRKEGCQALARMKDKSGVASLQAALEETDGELYYAALDALSDIDAPEAGQAAAQALKSGHNRVRQRAALHMREKISADFIPALWQAYQAEANELVAGSIADALIKLKFSDTDKDAIRFLFARLDPKVDPKKKPYWFDDVRLLRHLTGQKFGPEYKWADKKEREAEFLKWQQWWESAK